MKNSRLIEHALHENHSIKYSIIYTLYTLYRVYSSTILSKFIDELNTCFHYICETISLVLLAANLPPSFLMYNFVKIFKSKTTAENGFYILPIHFEVRIIDIDAFSRLIVLQQPYLL